MTINLILLKNKYMLNEFSIWSSMKRIATVTLIFILTGSLNAVSQVNTKIPNQDNPRMNPDSVNSQLLSRTFPIYNFDISEFKAPPRQFGPFTRWWWPGNDVTDQELQREIKLFADNGFAGVEIQPFFSGLNKNGPAAQLKKQLSWDTPSFYGHVAAVMEQARKAGMIVDMTAGSGWPIAGPQVSLDSSILTLAYADTVIQGNQQLTINIPRLKADSANRKMMGMKMFFQPSNVLLAKLQVILAARIKNRASGQLIIDQPINITESYLNNKLNWKAPDGEWEIFTVWAIPDGELPKAIATIPVGYVADPFDSTKIKDAYQHLFSKRTGLDKYFGQPFRAVFNDSYEFMPDRHYEYGFLKYFMEKRGYDITTLLPLNLQKWYNDAYLAPIAANSKAPFAINDQDWRIRYDYDLTISDMFRDQFLNASRNWLNKRGLLHRTQAYGVKMDIIRNSGAADIPEAEQLAGANSEGFIKLVTSGAHLANKPVISQESFVFRDLADMTTPQKIKILSDKSFASGINQIIFHGTPYKYNTDEYGKEGWRPFSSPMDFNDFSSVINESSPFWNDIKSINTYITRVQYALRSGKPHTDVLIYFPFVDFADYQIRNNPEEILPSGNFIGVEPERLKGGSKPVNDAAATYYLKLWPLVNRLEAAGLTWEFANDDVIQKATLNNGQLMINNNSYQALIIPRVPYIQLGTARTLNELSKDKINILFYESLPDKQPSYFNYTQNDSLTSALINESVTRSTTRLIKDTLGMKNWISSLTVPIKFKNNYSFTRQLERKMDDGSRINFIWNKSDQWQTIELLAEKKYTGYYWVDAVSGRFTKSDRSKISYKLPPYGSVIFYATNHIVKNQATGKPSPELTAAKTVIALNKWQVKSGNAVVTDTALFDWRNVPVFKYKSEEGVYNSSFTLKKQAGKSYYIDLGKVFFTAEIFVNGQNAGKLIWAPYQADITNFLKLGDNHIEIKIIPTQRNEFIGEGIKNNPKYKNFKSKSNTLMPAGLIGPVYIKEL